MRTMFVDVDTQIDFVYPAGSLYVPGAERVVPNVAALNSYAVQQGSLLISTADAHAEDDPEFHQWPAHCVKGTIGQQKPSSTLMTGYQIVPNVRSAPLPQAAPQIVLEKQVLDAFSNPHFTTLIEGYRPERCVVYGVVTEICVQFAVEGLQRHCKRIEVVTDAVRALDHARADDSLRRWQSDGVLLVTTTSILQ
jgi:nicotinamidase/pyrazinamidase